MSGGFLYSEFHCYTIAHWAPITTLDPIVFTRIFISCDWPERFILAN